ncbi:unnamed protein product [Discula destructiva]
MGPKRGPLRPELPAKLLEQVGGHAPDNSSRPRGHQTTRKDRRKKERVHKRQRNVGTKSPSGPIHKTASQATSPKAIREQPAKPGQSKLRIGALPDSDEEDEEDENQDDDAFGGFSDDETHDELDHDRPSKPVISKATMEKLSKEDAEIADLERKLGINHRRSLPKSFQEDGLGDILGDLNEVDEEEGASSAKKKRKAEAEEWLAQKRRKALKQTIPQVMDVSEDDLDGLDSLVEGTDLESGDDFNEDRSVEGHLSSDGDRNGQRLGRDAEEGEKPVRKRENPYVAPIIAQEPAQKYVPPARRQETDSDAELLLRIRRQTQGLINRLTEPNLLVILADIEKLYREYPRQHVTSILIDLVLVQICEPTNLPDTLLILYAGFSTAAYQVIGPDFGAQLIQHTVERFNDYHAKVPPGDAQNVAKYTSNLITFISQIYNFQLIGCTILFDYIRLLLGDLSELNAELLLRIVRMAGQSLRRDDPLALKDIVALIGPAVKTVGEANLSVRTKFLIESINDLKNNKVKTGASASAIVQEHMTRIKKLLGSMNTRKLKATEPLRIGLKDIQDADTRGKWWLVGASWAGRNGDAGKQSRGDGAANEGDDLDSIALGSDDDGGMMPDLDAIAREQHMNTDVRRSIFIATMSASDYEDAYARLMKLRLNKHRQKEIAYVLIQCVGCEKQYNPYYSLVARRACGDSRVKFAFQDSLWKFFRRLGEPPFGEDEDDEDEDETVDARRILSVAKMFGYLIANGAVGLSVLKCLSLARVKPKARDFVEVMLNTLFLEVAKAGTDVGKIFGAVADMPELSQGLQYFLRNKTQKTELVATKKDGKKVKKGAQKAIGVLQADPKIANAKEEEED